MDQHVDEYLPNLKGSGYEGVRIKDVLQMASGVRFNEDYGDFFSDINRWVPGGTSLFNVAANFSCDAPHAKDRPQRLISEKKSP